MSVALPDDIDVLARGWLHGNVVLLRGAVPALIDTGYHTGIDELRERFERFVGPASSLQRVALTHVHSDHAGGVAAIRSWGDCAAEMSGPSAGRAREPLPGGRALHGVSHRSRNEPWCDPAQRDPEGEVPARSGRRRATIRSSGRRSEAEVVAHVDLVERIDTWDEPLLWLGASGQELPRFQLDTTYVEGDRVALGDRSFEVVWTPGHAAGGVALFDATDGLLVTGDALWQDGFGLLNPWVEGDEVGALTARALAALRRLPARLVVPGHGAPFTDVSDALDRADARLAYLLANPDAMRRAALRSNAAFYALAHPDATEHTLREATLAMCRSHGRLPGDGDPRSDEALTDFVLAQITAARG